MVSPYNFRCVEVYSSFLSCTFSKYFWLPFEALWAILSTKPCRCHMIEVPLKMPQRPLFPGVSAHAHWAFWCGLHHFGSPILSILTPPCPLAYLWWHIPFHNQPKHLCGCHSVHLPNACSPSPPITQTASPQTLKDGLKVTLWLSEAFVLKLLIVFVCPQSFSWVSIATYHGGGGRVGRREIYQG